MSSFSFRSSEPSAPPPAHLRDSSNEPPNVGEATVSEEALADLRGQVAGINQTQAVIHFTTSGIITDANDIFCTTLGYRRDEIVGQHHRLFVDKAYAESDDYRAFWSSLARGEARVGEFMRIAKDGREVWIRASYTPIRDTEGQVFKIVKYASDITEQKIANLYFEGQIRGISQAQAVIEFEPDGTIVNANDNFCRTVGYSLEEIRGKHHSMFVEPADRSSAAYQQLWDALAAGNAQVGEFRRVAKGGRELWIHASYTPILDPRGRVYRVVKYASDVTEEKRRNADFQGQIEGISASQAVIQFYPDGTIIEANDNFLRALGYTASEIKGKHHSLFVEPGYRKTPEYAEFWKALAAGDARVGEFCRYRKDGKEIWIQASYTPIKDLSGNVFKVVKYATDITERKQTVAEISRLIVAAREGRLDERAGTAGASGDNLLMRENVNAMLDTIAGPITEVVDTMRLIAGKDLTGEVTGDYAGQFGELKSFVNIAIGQLNESMRQMSEAAAVVKAGAFEISQGNSELSVRTEEQAASLEETASAMEQMTATVQQNASNAKHADSLAQGARSAAEKGGKVVGTAINAMAKINESSKRISDIIGVIDEIAFQTNLLALNASVEAARAGEQGRGFAVVADEVRNLAGRSAVAAKEIKELIQDSGERVSEGSDLVNQSGETLEEIVQSVKKVTDIVSEIMAATDEQASGIASVNTTIQQMDEMTQQNAALVEEAAAASEQLGTQADQVNNMVEQFAVRNN